MGIPTRLLTATLPTSVNGGGLEQPRTPLSRGDVATVGSATGGDSSAAHAVGKRIRSSVEGEAFGTGQNPPVITVSIGVASLPEHATTADSLVDQADAALYRAKRLGKNRVEVDRVASARVESRRA